MTFYTLSVKMNTGDDDMSEFSMTKKEFINQWLRNFAPDLSKKDYKNCYVDQYIWHVFSFGLITDGVLKGDEARRAFDKAVKDDCYCLDIFGSKTVTDNLPSKYDTAEKIDNELIEFYVVAKDYTWTYIKTHENDMCGPYFMSISKDGEFFCPYLGRNADEGLCYDMQMVANCYITPSVLAEVSIDKKELLENCGRCEYCKLR